MSKNSTIQIRIDSEIKKDTTALLERLGLTISDAVGIFFRQVLLNKGIPFDVKIPNKTTVKTLSESEKGKSIKSFNSIDELYKDLND